MGETKSNKKIGILVFSIVLLLVVIAGYFIFNFSSSTEQEAKKDVKKVEQMDKMKTDNDENFGIGITDPSKAGKDIQDEKTLNFIAELSKHDPNYPTSYGDPNAPLTVIEFSDFSCPMCAQFHKNSFPMIDKLVDAGKVKVKYMPFATFKEDGSHIAAAGAIAAGKQGKFREYSHLAFSKATTSGHQTYTKKSVLALAKEAGVANLEEFNKVINDQAVYDDLDSKILQYSSWGISGTPSTIVGKTFLHGALPNEYVAATLVDQLKKALK